MKDEPDNLCPECGKEANIIARDFYRTSYCEDGHVWHTCLKHRTITKGESPENGLNFKACSCGKIKYKPVKMVIVMRKDLNMRKGKMISQGSHGALNAILQQMSKFDKSRTGVPMPSWDLTFSDSSPLGQWLEGTFTKVCVYVESEEELIGIQKKAESRNINNCLITDNGLTEFNGEKTITCLAIGPDFSEVIDEITGHLKLL